MQVRALHFDRDRPAEPVPPPFGEVETGWVWIDVEAGHGDFDELSELIEHLGLESLALRDALEDRDLPKVDDFGHSSLVVLHGLADDEVAMYELDCFLTADHLVTIHRHPSPAVDVLWDGGQRRSELGSGGAGEFLGRLADVVTRRLMYVLDTFALRAEELTDLALRADPAFLGEITAIRSDLTVLRRVIHPQREILDVLRQSTSPLLSDASRRRFSDVFDVASRAAAELDSARTVLAEILDAYRGAEAKQASEVTKVLTVYAATMLPLSLVVGFFGMNFENLPLVDRRTGWVIVAVFMTIVAVLSLGVFTSLGWTRRPSGRAAGALLGRGLVEAARTPAQLVGAVYEISTMPMRTAVAGRQKNLS